MRRHQHPRGLRGHRRRVGRRAQQALDQPARAYEGARETLGDGRIVARGVVDRAQQPAVLGEERDEAVDHLARDLMRVPGGVALDAVDERIVGVRQELGREARQVVEVPVEDGPREPRLRHHGADRELGERAVCEQRAGRREDPRPREIPRDVRGAS